mgnify:CR=1 FL=1
MWFKLGKKLVNMDHVAAVSTRLFLEEKQLVIRLGNGEKFCMTTEIDAEEIFEQLHDNVRIECSLS